MSDALKAAYVKGVRGVGRALSAVGVVGDETPSRQQRFRHWSASLLRVHDSMAIADLDVPWWTYRSIDWVDGWMRARQKPLRVFEYGSGASTVWLASRADEVHTVEHHKGFHEHISEKMASLPGVTSHLVEPTSSSTPRVASGRPGNEGLDFFDYVDTINKVGGTFDLLVVDGRARVDCYLAGIEHLADDGIVVFDNSARKRYRDGIEGSGLTETKFKGLTPTLPYPEQTSVLAR